MKNWYGKRIAYSKEHQNKAHHEINELVFTERNGRHIVLDDGTKLIEFVSCSYLGLDMDSRVIQASTENIAKCGVTFSAARTRMQAKSFPILEGLLNKIFCNGYSTIFASLHLGHLGILPLLGSGAMPSFTLKEGGAMFILDKHVHDSIQINRALMQQFGTVELVDFSDHQQLQDTFIAAGKNNTTPIAIADSIGSMGGVAPIKLLFQFAEQYSGYIYLDDAHGTSVYGKYGCGYALQALQYTFNPRLILASSLAKAFGSVAGVIVLPTQEDADMVKSFGSTYIFGGPPILSSIDAAIASAHIHLSGEVEFLQKKLYQNIKLFDSLISKHVVNSGIQAPIRGLFVGDELKAIEYTKALRKLGFAVTAAMYPAVARSKSILRVSLSAVHSEDDIHSFVSAVKSVLDC